MNHLRSVPLASPCTSTTPCACGSPISCHANADDVARDLKTCTCPTACEHPRIPDPDFIAHDGCDHCPCTSSRRSLYAAWRLDPDAASVTGGAR